VNRFGLEVSYDKHPRPSRALPGISYAASPGAFHQFVKLLALLGSDWGDRRASDPHNLRLVCHDRSPKSLLPALSGELFLPLLPRFPTLLLFGDCGMRDNT
jgi:hypothetical protein